jgi:N-acetyl-anhydromuramyl-L-alanine amidase AmpD
LTLQPPAALPPTRSTLDLAGQGPSSARSYIIIEGQEVPVPDAKVVTFRDDPSWDFRRLPAMERPYVMPRRSKGQLLATCDALQDVVRAVILHTDITDSSRACFRVLAMRGFSTHFMIDGDGTIYQGTDPVDMAIHAASELIDNLNLQSIGIDINCLQVNQRGAKSPGQQVGNRQMSQTITINDVPWQSVGFSDAQYDALIKLLFALKSKFQKIQLSPPVTETGEVPWSIVQPDLEKFGIYGHLHMSPMKFDPGPGFDWQRLQAGLSQEHNFFPVVLQVDQKTGRPLNINNVLIPARVRQLAEVYFRNTEGQEAGGYYPVGLSGQWHGGIHLHVPKGSDVLAMFPGKVVVARNGPESAHLGSNNFVVLRHEVKFDPNDERRILRFYTLYMHLLGFDGQQDKTDDEFSSEQPRATADQKHAVAPYWLRKLRGDATSKLDVLGDAAADPEAKAEPKSTRKGKRGRNKGLAAATANKPAATAEDDDAGDQDDPETADEPAPFLDHGDHLAALLAGKVAYFSATANTWVQPGERIGRVGEFGDPDERTAVLHLEVFTDESWRQAVDLLGVHSAQWWEPQGDPDDNLQCDAEDLLRLILPEAGSRQRRNHADALLTQQYVSSDDVVAFYADPPAVNPDVARVRKAITRHVSEWSDQVDWFRSLAQGQDWQDRVDALSRLLLDDDAGTWRNALFARQISRQLPFIWLTEDVAKHLGLQNAGKWDGVLYHFHPIHFLLWLTLHTNTRVRALTKGMSRKEFLAIKKKEQQAEAERRARGEYDFHGDDTASEAVDELTSPQDALDELWEVPLQPDEWRRPEPDTD